MNIAGYLTEGIQKYGEYECFTYIASDKKIVLTNTEINERSRALAAGLKKSGVKQGDVVGVMVSNIPEIPELMMGTMRMGGVFLPIIFMLTPGEIRYILEDCKTHIIITEKRMLDKINEAIAGNDNIKKNNCYRCCRGQFATGICSLRRFCQPGGRFGRCSGDVFR